MNWKWNRERSVSLLGPLDNTYVAQFCRNQTVGTRTRTYRSRYLADPPDLEQSILVQHGKTFAKHLAILWEPRFTLIRTI